MLQFPEKFAAFVRELRASSPQPDWNSRPEDEPEEYVIRIDKTARGVRVTHNRGRERPVSLTDAGWRSLHPDPETELTEKDIPFADYAARVGPALGELLFASDDALVKRFLEKWRHARHERTPPFLRLRLDLRGPRLGELPWEAFSLPGPDGEPIVPALLPGLCLVVGAPNASTTAAAKGLLRALVMGSAGGGPAGHLPEAARMVRDCADALKPLVCTGHARTVQSDEKDVSHDDLLRLLRDTSPDVVMLYGHVEPDPNVPGTFRYLAAKGVPVPQQDLVDALAANRPPRFVAIVGCDSTRLAEALVAAGVPAVLAMRHPVSERPAGDVMQAFADAVGRLHPVEVAVAAARHRVRARDVQRANRREPPTAEWISPRLYLAAARGALIADDDARWAQEFGRQARRPWTDPFRGKGRATTPARAGDAAFYSKDRFLGRDWSLFREPRMQPRGSETPAGDERNSLTVREVLAHNGGHAARVAVVAPAGGGKSTLGRALEEQRRDGRRTDDGWLLTGSRVAVLLKLERIAQDWSGGRHRRLLEYARDRILATLRPDNAAKEAAREVVSGWLEGGKCALVLDGLDEAARTLESAEDLARFTGWLRHDLDQSGYGGPAILTLRASAAPALAGAWDDTYVLEPMSEKDAASLLAAYDVEDAQAHRVAEQLVADRKRLLPATPLMVHFFGFMAENGRNVVQALAWGRQALYQEVVGLIIDRCWEQSSAQRETVVRTPEDRKKGLDIAAHTALALYERGLAEDFTELDVREAVEQAEPREAARWLHWLRSESGLIEAAGRKPPPDDSESAGDDGPAERNPETEPLRWWHNSIGEFLAGHALIQAVGRRKDLRKQWTGGALDDDTLVEQAVSHRVWSPTWTGVWAFVASCRETPELSWSLVRLFLRRYRESGRTRHDFLQAALLCYAERKRRDRDFPHVRHRLLRDAEHAVPRLLRQGVTLQEMQIPLLAEEEDGFRKWLVETARQNFDPRVHIPVRRLVARRADTADPARVERQHVLPEPLPESIVVRLSAAGPTASAR